MRRGDADLQRYVFENAGITTAAERARQIDDLIRYRRDDGERPLAYPRGMQFPPGFQAGDTATIAAPLVNNQANAIYLGQAPDDLRVIKVRMEVVQQVVAPTWAELAICTALEAPFGSPDLILEGFTDVASTFNTAGTKDTEIAVDIARDAHCYLVWGSNAATWFTVRGGLGDPLGTGRNSFAAATRPSTMASPTTFTATTSASVAAWISFVW